MNYALDSEAGMAQLTAEQKYAAMFASLIAQQTNFALMFLGKAPSPETGKTTVDLEAAEFMINQLEMLQAKTKGNLDARETQLLQQSLMSLRMAYVEAVNATPAQTPPPPSTAVPPSAPDQSVAPEAAAQSDESRKKFTKKY
jgi:hypothetical protein